MERPPSAKFGRRAESACVYPLLAPMKLLPFEAFSKLGSIPRSNSAKTEDYSKVEGRKACIIFVSHRWLRPSLNPSQAHPDDPQNRKYKLILDAVGKLKTTLTCDIYLWLDFACIDQDDSKMKLNGILSLPGYIERCHLTLTPIVDLSFEDWFDSLPTIIPNYWTHYPSKPFQEYRDRGWCRLEAWITSNVPMPTSVNFFELSQSPSHRSDRPHVLYGTWQTERRRAPVILPPLQHSFLEQFHPLKGHLTDTADLQSLAEIIEKVPTSVLEVGYKGEMQNGMAHGRGRKVMENGNVYEGEFQNDKPHGKITFYLSGGDIYEGDYENGLRSGYGDYKFANGERYLGEWKKGTKHGNGEFFFTNGDVFRGEYANGKKHGKGRFIFAKGGWKEAIYSNGEEQKVLAKG
eukprot:NODE_1675_length_1416_cov_86.633825_g1590_i0.p1 GENE.NODE_1675_length_1416_cov_86.633825_g1590_i0~~NODE_1675_length_1416_cov_86.633825_g1590_i0.p1  ORF type:complete len:405 (+),score=96.12 NODE_1675_length_1416_cov_86.633825_g1590_i0:50-1264(+)